MVPKIGCKIWEGNYNVKRDTDFRYGKRLKYFEYNWLNPEIEKIVVFSDQSIPNAANPMFKGVKHKVAWMLESQVIYNTYGQFKQAKQWLLSNLHEFSAVATYDDELISKHSDIMTFVPLGLIVVPENESVIYSKTKLCSMSLGVRYDFRNDVFNRLQPNGKVDFLGRGVDKPFKNTADVYRDYMYCLVMPVCRDNRYFAASLVDPLACGTVPIWWGCDISDFFDMDGIITVSSEDELCEAVEKISADDYMSRMEAIKRNKILVEKYRTPENNLWTEVLQCLT